MKFGVCASPDAAAQVRAAGYDFLECTVGGFVMPDQPAARFEAALADFRQQGFPCLALNCFLPASLRVTGPDVDRQALERYVSIVCERAGRAGVTRLVFGSGGARRVPEGFPVAEAHQQILAFLRLCAPMAERHRLVIVIEPLNTHECNILTHVSECAAMVREVRHPAIRLLADIYHMLQNGETADDLAPHVELLRHVHIATRENRRPPAAEPCDFAPFFRVLKAGGYSEGVSVEARAQDPAREWPAALALMNALADS